MKVDVSSVNQFLAGVNSNNENASLKKSPAIVEQISDKITISSEAAALLQQALAEGPSDGSETLMNGGGTEPPLPPKDKN